MTLLLETVRQSYQYAVEKVNTNVINKQNLMIVLNCQT